MLSFWLPLLPFFLFFFSYSFFLLGWQAGKSSLCVFSVAVTLIQQNKAGANPALVHLNRPIEVRRQSQHGPDPRGTGAGAMGGHGALMTQQSPCPLGAQLVHLAAAPWTCSRLSRPLSGKALVFCLGKLMTQYLLEKGSETLNSFKRWCALRCPNACINYSFCGAERSKIHE